jgi:hypothetical protein
MPPLFLCLNIFIGDVLMADFYNPSNANYLAPVGFKFVLGRAPNVQFFCQAAAIPEMSIGVRTIQTPIKDYEVPGDKMQFGDLRLTFLVNETLDNYYEIYKWMRGLTGPRNSSQTEAYLKSVDEAGRTTDFSKQMSDARLMILDSNYNVVSAVNFQNIFPISLSTLSFDSNQTDIQYFTAQVEFKYTILDLIDENGTVV